MSRALPLLLLSACLRPPPPPPPPPPPQVPPGCLAELSGRWALASDPSWRYDATDDGGTVELRARHVPFAVDAGFRPRRFRLDAGVELTTPPRDGGQREGAVALIVLDRTWAGFLGATRAPWTDSQGRGCEASFRTLVLECGDGGLVVRTEPSVELDDVCQASHHAPPAGSFVEHRLVRVP